MSWWEYLRKPAAFEQNAPIPVKDNYGVAPEGTSQVEVVTVERELAQKIEEWKWVEGEVAVDTILLGCASALCRFAGKPDDPSSARLYDFCSEVFPPLLRFWARDAPAEGILGGLPVPRKAIYALRQSTIQSLANKFIADKATYVTEVVFTEDLESVVARIRTQGLPCSRLSLFPFILCAVAILAPASVAHTFCTSCLLEIEVELLPLVSYLTYISGVVLHRHTSHRSSYLASCVGLLLSKFISCGAPKADEQLLSTILVSVCTFNRAVGETDYEEQADDSQGVGRNVLFTLAATTLSWAAPRFKTVQREEGGRRDWSIVFEGPSYMLENLLEVTGQLAIYFPRSDLYEFSYNINTVVSLEEPISDLELTPKCASLAIFTAVMTTISAACQFLQANVYPFSHILTPRSKLSALIRPMYVLCRYAMSHPSDDIILETMTSLGLIIWNISDIDGPYNKIRSAHESGFELGKFIAQMCLAISLWASQRPSGIVKAHALSEGLASMIAQVDDIDEVGDMCFKAVLTILESPQSILRAVSASFVLKHWRHRLATCTDQTGISRRYAKVQEAVYKAADSINSLLEEANLALDVCSTIQLIQARTLSSSHNMLKVLQKLENKASEEMKVLQAMKAEPSQRTELLTPVEQDIIKIDLILERINEVKASHVKTR